MGEVTHVRKSSLKRLIYLYQAELVVCIRFLVGAALIFAVVYLVPQIVQMITLGQEGIFLAILMSLLAIGCALLAVKTIVSGVLHLMMLKSLKSMDFAKSMAVSRTALRFLKYWPLVRSVELSPFETGLGASYMGQAFYGDAEDLFDSAVFRVKKHIGPLGSGGKTIYYAHLAGLLGHLSRSYSAQGKYPEAERAAAEGIEYARSTGRKNHSRMEAFPVYALAYSHLRSGALVEAENEYNMVLKLDRECQALKEYGTSSLAFLLLGSKVGLATVAVKKGDESAASYWREFEEMESQFRGKHTPTLLSAYNLLADECIAVGQKELAGKVVLFGCKIAEKYPDHPDGDLLREKRDILLLSSES